MPRDPSANLPAVTGGKSDNLCRGGNSFNCKRASETAGEDSHTLGPHPRVTPVWCRKCDAYMGCETCAQKIDELACLRCNDWATDAGERKHGRMLAKPESLIRIRQLIANLPKDMAKEMPAVKQWEIEDERDRA